MNKKHNQFKTNLLPKLCSSTSTKHEHIKLSHHRHRRCSSSLSDEDPSSPRVGCMGQVKRNNKVIAFPTIISFTSNTPVITKTDNKTNTNIITSNISIVKYHKLKKLFSSRTLFSGLSPTNTFRATTRVRTHKPVKEKEKGFSTVRGSDQKGSLVNLEEMDPPLPVLKRVDKEEEEMKKKKKEESSSLWKRRSGGVPLKSLQVQVVHNQGQVVFST